jgi:glycosyltransferase involved in cell wall biosynthesis
MQDRSPLVSVVMPVFNGERYLTAALRSVLAQTYAPIELICIDDASTDGTRDILASFGDRITLIDSPRNCGIGGARNLGLPAARGDAIAFMDADDLWEPKKLAIQMRKLVEDAHIDLSFTHMRYFISPELPEEEKARRVCPPEPVAGYLAASLVARRAVFDKIGLFDPQLRVGEFIDWFARAKDAGFRYAVEDPVLLHRRIHDRNTVIVQDKARVDYVKVVRQALARRKGAAQ